MTGPITVLPRKQLSARPPKENTMRDTRTAPRRTSRRQWLAAALPLLGAGGLVASGAGMAPAATPLDVGTAPAWGGSHHWGQHCRASAFHLAVHGSGNSAAPAPLGLPQKWGSCH